MSDDKAGQGGAILVTGGSGFIGKAVVRRLADNGETVVSMYRHRLPEGLRNVYPVCSDMSSAELLAAPLRGVDTVVHLAWEGNFIGSEPAPIGPQTAETLPHNLIMLRNLIVAMERAGTKRLIFVSALGASRQATVPFLKEKYGGEFLVLNSRIPERVIVRPALVCGRDGLNDRFIRSVMRLMRVPGVYPVPRQKEPVAPLHVDDLANTLAETCRYKLSAPCALIDLTGGETFAVGELMRLVSQRYGKGAKLPIGGALGESLLPLFERQGRDGAKTPGLKQFLALNDPGNLATKRENPLNEVVPEKLMSFRDALV